MAISFTHRGVLVIVLDEENVERIQANDPFEFMQAKSPFPQVVTMPLRILIAYARKEELIKIQAMAEFPSAVMQYLTRGMKITETDLQRGDPYYKEL